VESNGLRMVRLKRARKLGLCLIEARSLEDEHKARKALVTRRADILFRLADAEAGALSEIEEVLNRYGY
jgi:hypothetical protein